MGADLVRLLRWTELASALFMTGLIWFVQVVHYPLLAKVHLPREGVELGVIARDLAASSSDAEARMTRSTRVTTTRPTSPSRSAVRARTRAPSCGASCVLSSGCSPTARSAA